MGLDLLIHMLLQLVVWGVGAAASDKQPPPASPEKIMPPAIQQFIAGEQTPPATVEVKGEVLRVVEQGS